MTPAYLQSIGMDPERALVAFRRKAKPAPLPPCELKSPPWKRDLCACGSWKARTSPRCHECAKKIRRGETA